MKAISPADASLDDKYALPSSRVYLSGRLIEEYETMIRGLLNELTATNHAIAVQLARLSEEIRGFGHIKARNLWAAKAREAILLPMFQSPPSAIVAAK